MKRREDELIELAFGELDGARAEELRSECSCDPKARQALSDYQEMREALRCLKDIPEMQMSSERLRDAILKEGLKPHRAPWFNWNLLAWPAAACLMVAIGVNTVHRLQGSAPSAEPMIVAKGDTSLAGISPQLDYAQLNAHPFEAKGSDSPTPAPVQIAKVVPKPEPDVRIKPHRRRRVDTLVAMTTSAETHAALAPTAKSEPLTQNASAVAANENRSAATPIVMIDPTPAPDTGADKAKEVAADNVVIGG